MPSPSPWGKLERFLLRHRRNNKRNVAQGSPDGNESASMTRNRHPGHCSDGLRAQLGTIPMVFDASMDGRILQTGHNVKRQKPGNLLD